MPDIDLLNADQTRPLIDEIIEVYQAAFSPAPYSETTPDFWNFAGRLSFYTQQPGFRCAVARPPGAERIVGFVFGYSGLTGSWFYNLALKHVSASLMGEYLDDFFEFAEFGLLPAWQRQGIGGRLHDTLLAGLGQRTACLLTPQVETNALHLYLKRGWVPLARAIELPNTPLPHQIMGLKLAGHEL
jgi:GNAT superfamily N-acetyltransferase